MRLLAVANRDVDAATTTAAAAGFTTRGPFTVTSATGAPMKLVEIAAGDVSFELVQFG